MTRRMIISSEGNESHTVVSWFMTLYGLVTGLPVFLSNLLLSTLKMEAECFFKAYVSTYYQTLQHHF
jgi:hypothetical protein